MQVIVSQINFEDDVSDGDVGEENELFDQKTADSKAIDFMATNTKHLNDTEKEVKRSKNTSDSNCRNYMIKWKMNLRVLI